MKRNRAIAAAVLAAAAVALAACATDPAPPESGERPVRTVFYRQPTSLTLVGNTDYYSGIVAALVGEGLVQYDEALDLVPRVAESWTLDEREKTVEFRLREGVRWHDGHPVTADDVVFTIEKVRDPETQARSWVAYVDAIEEIEAVDPLTVRVRYGTLHPDFLDAWTMPLLPAHMAGGEEDFLSGPFSRHPVGCGPFRFVRADADREIVLEANDDYWDGRPSIGSLVFRIVPDERTAFEALLRGEVDLLSVTPEIWRESNESARARDLARLVYWRLVLWYVGWNVDGTNPYFDDPRVRRAIVLALDRETFVERVIGSDLGRVAAGLYPPGTKWTDESLSPLPYDPVAAARLLDEAGWTDRDGDGVRDREGRPFRFELLTAAGGQEVADRMAAWMQQQLAAIGIEMEIAKVEWRLLQERRASHAFEAAMAAWTFDPSPERFEILHTSARETGLNYGGFSDAVVDRLLEEGRATLDRARRREIYVALQRRLHDLQPVAPLFHFASPVLHDDRLEGVRPSRRNLFEFVPGPRAWRWSGSGGED